jgi:hypothetical protein
MHLQTFYGELFISFVKVGSTITNLLWGIVYKLCEGCEHYQL